MSAPTTCTAEAQDLTGGLGFSCLDVDPVASFNNPLSHYSWTMPVLEVLVLAGAAFALVHAVQRLRRDGDPTNLALWFASLVYLAVTEPPLYFPEWFGLDRIYGLIFAHNEFTVQLMYDRLPLYIVALYPLISTIAYEIARTLGIFRRGAAVGAIAVAFVSQVFYEIFDQLGPQLKWWAWNADNAQNQPSLASVPMGSVLLYASASIGFLAYLVVKLVGPAASTAPDHPRRSARSLGWRTVVAGALTPLGMVVVGLPSTLFGGDSPDTTAQAWALGIELALVWAAGTWLVAGAWLARSEPDRIPLTPFAAVCPATYLTAFAVFWLASLPEFLRAEGGFTAAGTPVGSGPYVVALFLAAAGILATLYRSRGPVPSQDPAQRIAI